MQITHLSLPLILFEVVFEMQLPEKVEYSYYTMCFNPSVEAFVTITVFLPLSLRQDGVFWCCLQLCNLKIK